jgi:hypothetical protein
MPCIHYKGLGKRAGMTGGTYGPICASGHDILKIAGGIDAWTKRVACFGDREGAPLCTDRAFKSPVEVEADRQWIVDFVTKHLPAIIAIKATIKPGEAGKRPCPACGHWLRVSRAASNGHMRASCENTDCNVRFME